MEKHRILYVTKVSKGGVAVVVDQLARALDKNIFEPIVLFDTPQSSMIRQELVKSDIKTIELMSCMDIKKIQERHVEPKKRSVSAIIGDKFGRIFTLIYFELKSVLNFFFRVVYKTKKFLIIIKKYNVDLVHTHSDLRHGQPEILAAKIAGIPCITHRHGFSHYTHFDKIFDHFINTNIYISNSVAKHHLAEGESRLKFKIIHNGVNTDNYSQLYDSEKIRKEFDCKPEEILIGHIARISWWKGHEVFIEALAQLIKNFKNVKGIIIGGLAELEYERNKRYLDSLQKMVKYFGIEEKILFTGHREDVPRIMAALDIIVNATSTREPFGLTIIEGMVSGKPVIATAAGGALDIIEDGVNGILVPTKDSNSLAKAIVKIIIDKKKSEKMGNAAKQRIIENFTVKHQITALQQLYESILNQ